MRKFILAGHLKALQGLYEVVELLAGSQPNVEVVTPYLKGDSDLEELLDKALESVESEDELVVCTDLLGGSVNNECIKRFSGRPRCHLITNSNLALLIQLMLLDESEDLNEKIPEILAAGETKPVYVNELLAAETEADEDF